jgi:hypothetical protein
MRGVALGVRAVTTLSQEDVRSPVPRILVTMSDTGPVRKPRLVVRIRQFLVNLVEQLFGFLVRHP